ncbi:MAG: Abi-alpha family protein [Rhizomicrobium sp.]
MDDDGKEVIKIGMEVALRPITEIAQNVLGIAGGDWLAERRRLNREKLSRRTDKILKERGVNAPEEPSPSIAIPLLSAAQEEGREELAELWAKLLATAMDPARKHSYRREFLAIVRELEPLDIRAISALDKFGNMQSQTDRKYLIAQEANVSEDMVAISFRNLHRLELTADSQVGDRRTWPQLSFLANELLKAIR